jgi:hypothetical protein
MSSTAPTALRENLSFGSFGFGIQFLNAMLSFI